VTAYTNSNVIAHDLPNEAGTQTVPEVPRTLLAEAWWRLRRSRLSMLCLAVVTAYFVVGLLSFLPYFDIKVAQQLSTDKSYAPPTFRHTWPDGRNTISPAVWFGLDFQGRSVFWRVLFGTRIALLITLGASILSISIGAVLGVIAGYFGGWVDDLITWLFSTVSSVPWLLLVIAMAYVLQGNETPQSMLHHPLLVQLFGGVTTVILAMGLTDWVGLCRLIRGEVLKLRERDFVLAARAVGLGNARILFRHILPNTYHVIIITFSLGAVSYVQAEVILAFLGLGVTDKPSWGRMIDDAKLALLRGVWWEVTAATVAIFILCLALNILGDALRDALDPKLRGLD
jgi:ABC-type dipeptide/oligopeptide/nickel transport system permease subunit